MKIKRLPSRITKGRSPWNRTQQPVEQSRTAAAEIIRLGKVHGIEHERVVKMVRAKTRSSIQASREFSTKLRKRGVKPLRATAGGKSGSPRAHRQRAAGIQPRARDHGGRARTSKLASSGQRRSEKTPSRWKSRQQSRKSWKGERHGGLFIPWSHPPRLDSGLLAKRFPSRSSKRAGLDSGTSTAGTELKFTEPGEFIQFLYNSHAREGTRRAHHRGSPRQRLLPKQTGRATGSWVGENPGTDVADSALTLGSIASSPKTYQSSSSYSRQLLAQAVIDVDTLVREDLARDLALAVDTVAIVGPAARTSRPESSTPPACSRYVDRGRRRQRRRSCVGRHRQDVEAARGRERRSARRRRMAHHSGHANRTLKRTARLGNTIGLPIWADDSTVDGYRQPPRTRSRRTTTKGIERRDS